MKYLHNANNNAFIILLNDALKVNNDWNLQLDQFLAYLNQMGDYHISVVKLQSYQNYPIKTTYDGKLIPVARIAEI